VNYSPFLLEAAAAVWGMDFFNEYLKGKRFILYIRFRINHNWLGSGFGIQQYREMEAGLVNAIIQLQQLATPPPPKPTSASRIPSFQSNNERIHGIIHSFVNKTLNKQAEEKEEEPSASGLTKQQEMVYATE